MSRTLKLGIVQPHRILDDPEAREREYLSRLEFAGRSGVDLALLPEDLRGALTDDGFDSAVAESIPGPFSSKLSALASAHKMWIAACQYERDGDTIWNTAYLIDRTGAIAGKYRKVHEAELYRTQFNVQVGADYPVFDTEFGRIGLMVCFDNIFPETSRLLALNGAELILFPDANFHPSEFDVETLARARAIDNGVWIARASYAVDVYTPGQWIGRSCLISPDGIIRADAGRTPGVLVCEADLDAERKVVGYGTWGINAVRDRIRVERRPETYHRLSER
ncbi:MAG TPA: carbon-nitrogen hydrolase family protein [Thermomicrobiales bacterium]|nr:carbon-nitrogen hydrolase family protein [Thermomicrobiales bacterium]